MYSDLALAISRGTTSKLCTRLIGETATGLIGLVGEACCLEGSWVPRRQSSRATTGQVGSVVVLVDRNRASLTKGRNNEREQGIAGGKGDELAGGFDAQGSTSIGVQRDQCGIVPMGDAYAVTYFDYLSFFICIEAAGK